ncbi:MAG: hypothetical protein HZB12_02720 [Candidatus Yonathbacteria bacterium]|nr:hypothetical protein [Candidatus Yonathbacteria bacterium]
MSFYAISALVNALASLSAGVFVLLKKRGDPVYITFALFSLSVFLWSLGYLFWQQATTPETALRGVHFFMASAIFISTTFLHFAWTFIGDDGRHRRVIVASYIIFGLFFLANLTPWFVSGVTERMSFPFWPVPGPLFHPFFVLWSLQIIFVLVVLYRAHKKALGEAQMQLKYIFWGTALGFLGGSTNYFLWYGIPIPPVGNILVASYVVAVAIAILRYHLFDINVIAAEFFTVAIGLFVLFKAFIADPIERPSEIVLFVFVSLFGYFLIRSVLKEVEQTEQAKKLLDMRSEFLTIASHQLKTPVTLIMGILSMMREGSLDKATDEERKNFIDGAYEKAVKLSDIIRDILFASDFDTKEFTIPEKNLVPVDANAFIFKLHADFKERAEKKGLILSYENRAQGSCSVLTDPRYLLQAMTNIVDNSIKYTLKGSVSLILENNDDSVTIIVRDTGVGVPLADQTRIFGKFNRASNAVDMYTDGSGLGLYIAKEIIDAHEDGKIVMNSKEGEGTEFVVTLRRV